MNTSTPTDPSVSEPAAAADPDGTDDEFYAFGPEPLATREIILDLGGDAPVTARATDVKANVATIDVVAGTVAGDVEPDEDALELLRGAAQFLFAIEAIWADLSTLLQAEQCQAASIMPPPKGLHGITIPRVARRRIVQLPGTLPPFGRSEDLTEAPPPATFTTMLLGFEENGAEAGDPHVRHALSQNFGEELTDHYVALRDGLAFDEAASDGRIDVWDEFVLEDGTLEVLVIELLLDTPWVGRPLAAVRRAQSLDVQWRRRDTDGNIIATGTVPRGAASPVEASMHSLGRMYGRMSDMHRALRDVCGLARL